MSDFFGSVGSALGSIFGGGDSSGGQGWGTGLLGALATGSKIYDLYSQNKDREGQLSQAQANADRTFAEGQRQFDINHQLALARLAQGGGGGGGGSGDALRIAKMKAIEGAYNTLINSVMEGNAGKASMLSKLIDQVQKPYAQANSR